MISLSDLVRGAISRGAEFSLAYITALRDSRQETQGLADFLAQYGAVAFTNHLDFGVVVPGGHYDAVRAVESLDNYVGPSVRCSVGHAVHEGQPFGRMLAQAQCSAGITSYGRVLELV